MRGSIMGTIVAIDKSIGIHPVVEWRKLPNVGDILILDNLELINTLLNAVDVCLGHRTGGLDGNYSNEDPIQVARDAIKEAQEAGYLISQ